jgi:hypothetical protein
MQRIILKIFLVTVSPFIINSICYSQHNVYTEMSLGASFPIPPFSNKNVNDARSGLAKPGVGFTLKAVKVISKEKLGIALLLAGSMNGFDSEPSIEGYMQANPGMELSWEKKIKKWKAISFTPGIIYYLRISKKADLENGVFTGVAYAKSPGYTLTGTGSNSTFTRDVTFKQTSVDAFTLSTSIRSGLHYRLNNNWGCIFSVSYNFLKPTFKDVEQISFGRTTNVGSGNNSIFSTQRKFTFTQNMNTINLSVGLTYKL